MAADFYDELGVGRKATDEEIRKAYRKLAAKYHPDRNPGDASAEARFKAINRAHDVLGNPKKRALYDEFGEVGLREGFNPNAARAYRGRSGGGFGGGLEDIFGGNLGGFGDLFGDVFRSRGPAKGRDAEAEVTVDFVSALRGASVEVRVPGVADSITVRVPAGADNGDRVRVAGHGTPGRNGGPSGDLLLTIRVQSHSHFQREGLDLKLDLPISVGEAYHGGKVRVPTLDGEVNLKVPRHAESGQTVRLKGKGITRQGRTGDLYVRFLVQLPAREGPDIEQAIDALNEATDLSERDTIRL